MRDQKFSGLCASCPPVCTGEFSMCRVNNGGCQDLCLLTSEGRVNCSCRGDRKLFEDNTCIGNSRIGHAYMEEMFIHRKQSEDDFKIRTHFFFIAP